MDGNRHVPCSSESEQPQEDPAANRPTKPHERKEGVEPAAKGWQDPPPKVPRPKGQALRPTGDESQTKLGDKAEELATALGFRSILPEGQRCHKPGEVAEKGSTIDLEYDHSGRAMELKMCNTTSTEYRLKAKAKEKAAKQKFADMHKLTPYTLVGVRDVDTGAVHFYVAKKPGFIGAEVSEKNYNYLGTVRP